MNDIDSPRAVTPPATIMSDEEEELREFCDGFDEGTTDRIVGHGRFQQGSRFARS